MMGDSKLKMDPFDRSYVTVPISLPLYVALCCTTFELDCTNNRDLEI